MLPRKLKNMNLFNDGISYVGQIEEVVLPQLNRVMEEWRAGGMNAPIKTDQGMEALSMEWTCGGLMDEPLRQFGITQHDGVLLRFAGAYQRDDSSKTAAVEVVVRGRHENIDMGTAKVGDNSPMKVTSALSYFKITIDSEEIIEIDIINMIEKVNGVDRLADQRAAIGL